MHYIIGTTFDVHSPIRGTADPAALEKNRYAKYFPEPGAYELYYIRRTKNNSIEYTFYNRTTGNKHKREFKNSGEADRIVSVMLGETLPNYSQNYEEMSD